MATSERERELASKLLETLHLSVSERAELSDGRIRMSALIAAARSALAHSCYLPSRLRPDDNYDGVVLELRDEVYWIHERHESGVNRFGPATTRRANDLREAVQAYVGVHGRSAIDGVPIRDDG
jgi:hypothetical protein